MEIYLINLDSRQDRLAYVSDQLSQLRLPFKRIPAVPRELAVNLAPALRSEVEKEKNITAAELACLLSHMKCWRRLIESPSTHALILEDDVVISPLLADLVQASPALFADRTGLIRLETYQKPVSLKRRSSFKHGSISFHTMHSTHWGAAAYIIHRDFAHRLVHSGSLPALPVDDILFNSGSSFFSTCDVYQAVPGVCIQGDRLGGTSKHGVYSSDIAADRKRRFAFPKRKIQLAGFQASKPSRLRREVLRVLRQGDERLGLKSFRCWLRGLTTIEVPFAGRGLHEYSATPFPVITNQQELQPALPALRFLDAA
jgi:glycosyl transferase family 25